MASKQMEDIAKGKKKGKGKKTQSMIAKWKKKSLKASTSKFQQYDDAAQNYYYNILKKAKRGDVKVVAVFYYANSSEDILKTLFLPYQYFPPTHAHWAVVQFIGTTKNPSFRGYIAIQHILSTWSTKWNPSREKHIRVIEKGARIGPLESDRAFVSMDAMKAKHLTPEIQIGLQKKKKKKKKSKKSSNIRKTWGIGFQLDVKDDGKWYGSEIIDSNADNDTILLTFDNRKKWISRQSLDLAPFGKFSSSTTSSSRKKSSKKKKNNINDTENVDGTGTLPMPKKSSHSPKSSPKSSSSSSSLPKSSPKSSSSSLPKSSPKSSPSLPKVPIRSSRNRKSSSNNLKKNLLNVKSNNQTASRMENSLKPIEKEKTADDIFLDDSSDNEDAPIPESTLDARIATLEESNHKLEMEISSLKYQLLCDCHAVQVAEQVEKDRIELIDAHNYIKKWEYELQQWQNKLQRLSHVTSIGGGLMDQLNIYMETGHIDLSKLATIDNASHVVITRVNNNNYGSTAGGSSYKSNEDLVSVSSGSYASDLMSVHSGFSSVVMTNNDKASQHSGDKEKLDVVAEEEVSAVMINDAPIPKFITRRRSSRRKTAELAALDALENL